VENAGRDHAVIPATLRLLGVAEWDSRATARDDTLNDQTTEERMLQIMKSVGSDTLRTARLSARMLVLTTILVGLGMAMSYVALLVFVANTDAVGFAWGRFHSIGTPAMDRYYRDRNLFLALGAAAGLVVSLCVSITLAFQSRSTGAGRNST
jgi:hypothetical protein